MRGEKLRRSFCCSELEKREKRWKEPTFPSDNNSRALFYYRVDVGEGCSREYANASGSKHHPPSPTFISNRRGSCFPKTDAGFFPWKRSPGSQNGKDHGWGGGGAKDSEAFVIGAGALSQVQRRAVRVFAVIALATALLKETLKRKMPKSIDRNANEKDFSSSYSPPHLPTRDDSGKLDHLNCNKISSL